MSFKNNAPISALFATLLTSFCATSFATTVANPENDARIASQYFERYHDQYDRSTYRGDWGLVDDLDIRDLLEEHGVDKLNPEIKALFTTDNQNGKPWNRKIQFDVQWTNKTLAKMYPEQWAEIKATSDRKTRKQLIRALRMNACDAQMEVGNARVYGVDSSRNVLEMDSHRTAGCPAGVAVGTSKMRTFISTVPNAEYMLTVKYQKRDYNYEKFGVKNEKSAFRDLIVRVNSDKYNLPLTEIEGEALDDGFKVKQIPFTASRFFTPIKLKDSGYPDSYGILIDSLVVEKVTDNPRLEACQSYYPQYSKKLRKCLTGDTEPEMMGCNLEEANVAWHKGANTSDNPERSTKENIFSAANSSFLSLGMAGKVDIKLRGNNVRAACPAEGKTLRLGEVTYGNRTFDQYAEQASIKVKLVRRENEALNGWKLLMNQNQNAIDDDESIVTKRSFEYSFDESYVQCAIAQIRVKV